MVPKRNDQQISDKVISVAAAGTEILGEESGMAHYQALNPVIFATVIPQCTTCGPVYLFLMTLHSSMNGLKFRLLFTILHPVG